MDDEERAADGCEGRDAPLAELRIEREAYLGRRAPVALGSDRTQEMYRQVHSLVRTKRMRPPVRALPAAQIALDFTHTRAGERIDRGECAEEALGFGGRLFREEPARAPILDRLRLRNGRGIRQWHQIAFAEQSHATRSECSDLSQGRSQTNEIAERPREDDERWKLRWVI